MKSVNGGGKEFLSFSLKEKALHLGVSCAIMNTNMHVVQDVTGEFYDR